MEDEALSNAIFEEIGELKSYARECLDAREAHPHHASLGERAAELDEAICDFYERRKLLLVALPHRLLDEFLDLVRIRHTYYADSQRWLRREEMSRKAATGSETPLRQVVQEVERLAEELKATDPAAIDPENYERLAAKFKALDAVLGLAGLAEDLWYDWVGFRNDYTYFSTVKGESGEVGDT